MKIKILHTGDWHISFTGQWDDVEEQGDCLSQLVKTAEEEKPNLIVISGDLTNHAPRKATPGERNLIVQTLTLLSQFAFIIILRGNHDYISQSGENDWGFLNNVGVLDMKYGHEPFIEKLGIMNIGFLPYPATRDVETYTENAFKLFRDNKVELIFGHCAIGGADIGTGQPLIGDPFVVPLEYFDWFKFVGLSHIHKQQSFIAQNWNVRYVGSLFPNDWGEIDPKGFDIIEYDTETKDVDIRRINTKYRQRLTVNAKYDGLAVKYEETGGLFNDDIYNNAKVRVIVEHPKGTKPDPERIIYRFKKRGAYFVRVEARPVNIVTAKMPVLADARELPTVFDKLQYMWKESNNVPANIESIKTKLHDIENEVTQ